MPSTNRANDALLPESVTSITYCVEEWVGLGRGWQPKSICFRSPAKAREFLASARRAWPQGRFRLTSVTVEVIEEVGADAA